MKIIVYNLICCLSLFIIGCGTDSTCFINSRARFDGDGVLIMENNTAEDGLTHVAFFPVCQLDTADILKSLKLANDGIVFSVDHQKVLNILRKRAVILTSQDEVRALADRNVYLTSVHISFLNTERQTEVNSSKISHYILNTEQVHYEKSVQSLGELHLDKLSGI